MDILLSVLYWYGIISLISFALILLFPIGDIISIAIGLNKFSRKEFKENHKRLSYFVIPILNVVGWLQWLYINIVTALVGKTYILAVPMWLITYKTKRWARNRVYNYFLQNGLQLKRLEERKPELINGRYLLKTTHKTEYPTGYIRYNKVNAITYIVASFLWLWQDDDNSFDVASSSYSADIYRGVYCSWIPFFIRKHCRTRYNIEDEGGVDPDNYVCRRQGKYFDVGDIYEDEFTWVNGVLWQVRNGFYNANYFYQEIRPGGWNDVYWLVEFKLFNKTIKWHFGFMRNTINPGHLGRNVFFGEDIHRIK